MFSVVQQTNRSNTNILQVWRALSMRVIDMQCRESGRPTDWLHNLHRDRKLMGQVIKEQKKWAKVKHGAEKKIVTKAELEIGELHRYAHACT